MSRARGLRVLITVGSTREHLDPVRFFSNASSGKMGLALARAFRSQGARVRLICGPGVLPDRGLAFRSVVSARDMLRAAQKEFPRCDIFVSAAAIADYRPRKMLARKMKRSARGLTVDLVANPDILATITRRKTHQFCVGFALEDSALAVSRARRKLKSKRCDLMVLNPLATMGSDRIRATLLHADGKVQPLGTLSKKECSQRLCQAILKTIRAR